MARSSGEAKDLIPMLFDFDLMRPGCVILQALASGDPMAFRKYFGGSDCWLTSITPGLKVYRGTATQWERVAKEMEAR